MKILVIGGTSAVAKVLIPMLADFSQVITTGRTDGDIRLDLSLESPIHFAKDIDVVIHLAAHFGGKKSEEIMDAEKINVLGTLRLCHAAVEANVRHFIFVSSIYSQIELQSPLFSSYALSKRHAEEAAQYFCDQNPLTLTILRPSQLYGNTEDFRKHQPFFYAMTDKAERGEDIVLFGKNDARRNFLHAEDLARLISKVVQQRLAGIYACQYPSDTSISEIARAASTAFNSKGKVFFQEEKENIQDNVFPIDEELYTKLNYYPIISVEEGMKAIAQKRILQA